MRGRGLREAERWVGSGGTHRSQGPAPGRGTEHILWGESPGRMRSFEPTHLPPAVPHSGEAAVTGLEALFPELASPTLVA